MKDYTWNTEGGIVTTTDVMNDFIDNHMAGYCGADYEVVYEEGSYVEIQKDNSTLYGVYASGNGDFTSHKVRFEKIRDSKIDRLRDLCAFQHWLGINYTNLLTDSDNMTERAELYIKINKKSKNSIMKNKENLIGKVGLFYDYKDEKVLKMGKLVSVTKQAKRFESEDGVYYDNFTAFTRAEMLEYIDLELYC